MGLPADGVAVFSTTVSCVPSEGAKFKLGTIFSPTARSPGWQAARRRRLAAWPRRPCPARASHSRRCRPSRSRCRHRPARSGPGRSPTERRRLSARRGGRPGRGEGDVARMRVVADGDRTVGRGIDLGQFGAGEVHAGGAVGGSTQVDRLIFQGGADDHAAGGRRRGRRRKFAYRVVPKSATKTLPAWSTAIASGS